MTRTLRVLVLAALALSVVATLPRVAAAATITIVNADTSGEGFNDPTAAAPVGGNPGTTVGQQRLNVFQQAATLWGGILPSAATINVQSTFDALTCTASSAVLGSAGATSVFSDFTGAEFPGTWYCKALADKEAGFDLSPGTYDIRARFNSSIGGASCLAGFTWYYGYDHNESASQIDLLAVILHEMAHGLGFQTFVTGTTGAQFNGSPDVFERFMYDNTTARQWTAMTNAERAASGLNTLNLVWNGKAATFMAPLTLSGRPTLTVTAPAGIAGNYDLGTASFGALVTTTPVSGTVVLADDGAAPTSDACTALVNGVAMAGRIAILDRGTCAFTVKAKNAQNAGAIAVIVVDNVVSATPPGLGGADATVTIPVVSVTQALGTTLKANIAAGLNVSIHIDAARLAGADGAGHPYLYSPNPYQSGSSLSHWDVSATPNLLMEPAINADLTSNVDLTRYVFEDIGWLPRTTHVPDAVVTGVQLREGVPNPFEGSTTIRFQLAQTATADLAVFDLSGRLVKRIAHGVMSAGEHAVTWDGTNQAGRAMPPGVYSYRLQAGPASESKHIVLFR